MATTKKRPKKKHPTNISDERLELSVSQRKIVLNRFGFIPYSTLKLSRGPISSKMFKLQAESPADRGQEYRTSRRKSTGLNAVANYVGQDKERKALSIMPAELVDFFVKYYSDEGQVYLDPFMGQGIQMQVSVLRRRHYYGYDISRRFFDYIDRVRTKISPTTTTDVHITCGDSRCPNEIPDDIGDFGFTSPPYWDLEWYGDEPEQLGKADSYDTFVSLMRDVAKAWLPKFKSGAYYVVNVNDFRRNGRFYCYHADVIRAHIEAGWEMHDIWIVQELVVGLFVFFG